MAGLNLSTPRVVKVIAGAGTGKTFVLERLASENPDMAFIYLAFNKSVRKEAQARFPKNVECHTINSLAFQQCGEKYGRGAGIASSLSFKAVRVHFKVSLAMAASIRGTLECFLNSADTEVAQRHFFVHDSAGTPDPDVMISRVNELWAIMQKGENPYLRMTHSGLLKLFQLSLPKLACNCVLCDESQDINPAQMDIVMRQLSHGRSIVLVGDPLQQIYSWRGAIDAMAQVDCEELGLTHSFRFGKRVAWLANRILGVYGLSKRPIVGAARWRDELFNTRIPHEPMEGETCAVLARTNVTVFTETLRLVNEGDKVAFNGEVNPFMTILMDIYNLKMGRHGRITEKGRISSMRSFEDFKEMCTVDTELNSLGRVVDLLNNDLPEAVETLRRGLIMDTRFARVTVSTIHKFKGLEADFVTLADDFPPMVKDGRILPLRTSPYERSSDCVEKEDLYLLYVGITRAKRYLAIPPSVSDLLELLRKNPNPKFYTSDEDAERRLDDHRRPASVKDLFK